MTKMLKTMFAVGLFTVGAASVVLNGTAIASAQATKASEKLKENASDKSAKDDKKPVAVKGSVIIKPDTKERFRISIKGEDGKTLLMSAGNGFETEKEAREAIEEIKAILKDSKITVEKGEPSKDAAKDK